MKILVTGGGGFIGMALMRRLSKEGHELINFSRKSYEEHQALGVSSINGDISKSEEVKEACKGVDVVFHVASKVGVWGSYSSFYKTNVEGTQNIIQSCLYHGVDSLIYTSSASVVFGGKDLQGVDESTPYPKTALSHYTATKAEAEDLVLKANCDRLKTISLRPHIVWGPGDTQIIPKILERARTGKLRKLGKKEVLIDITHIDNFIDAQVLALDKLGMNRAKNEVEGKAFFITNGQAIKTWDFINAILVNAGLEPVHRTLPKSVALFIAFLLESSYKLFRLKGDPFITRFLIKELCSSHWFDITAARDLLAYHPRVSFEEGMEHPLI